MRVKFWVPLLMGAVATLAGAQDAQTAKPSGREVVDKAVAALGGDRFLHLQSRVETGRLYQFFHDQMSGLELVKAYVEYVPPPAGGLGMQERQLLGKKRDYSYLLTPTAAWDITFRGARQVPDTDWQRHYRTTHNDVLYTLRYRLNEPGLQLDYIGSEVYLSRHVEVVDITDSADQVVRVYFDHNSYLPVRATYTWFDDKTKEHNDEATYYDKYRDIGGVMWPLVIERERNGYKVYQMFADSEQANQAMPPNIFELPAKAKILKTAK